MPNDSAAVVQKCSSRCSCTTHDFTVFSSVFESVGSFAVFLSCCCALVVLLTLY